MRFYTNCNVRVGTTTGTTGYMCINCHVRGIVGAHRGDVRAMYNVMTLYMYTDVAVTSYGGQKTKVLRAKGFLK